MRLKLVLFRLFPSLRWKNIQKVDQNFRYFDQNVRDFDQKVGDVFPNF